MLFMCLSPPSFYGTFNFGFSALRIMSLRTVVKVLNSIDKNLFGGHPLMSPIFWDFWPLPPPCHPFTKKAYGVTSSSGRSPTPKWVTSFMDGPLIEINRIHCWLILFFFWQRPQKKTHPKFSNIKMYSEFSFFFCIR